MGSLLFGLGHQLPDPVQPMSGVGRRATTKVRPGLVSLRRPRRRPIFEDPDAADPLRGFPELCFDLLVELSLFE